MASMTLICTPRLLVHVHCLLCVLHIHPAQNISIACCPRDTAMYKSVVLIIRITEKICYTDRWQYKSYSQRRTNEGDEMSG
jgi:hypothetical protein